MDRKMAAIDFFGAFLALAGSALLVLALTWAGGEHPWDSAHVLASLMVGIVTSLGFIVWQWKGTRVPLVPSMLLHQVLTHHGHQLTVSSGYIQTKNGEWGNVDHVRKWLGISGPDLLCALFLPVGIRLLGSQIRRSTATNYFDAE